jgi:hypothetical protein
MDADYATSVGVKFMIGQVGEAKAATEFLQEIGRDTRIEGVVFVAAGELGVVSPYKASC